MIKLAGSFETSVRISQTIRRQILDDATVFKILTVLWPHYLQHWRP